MRSFRLLVLRAVIAICLVPGAAIGAVTAFPLPSASASAVTTGNDYPWASVAPTGYSPLGFSYRFCTDFVAWKLNEAEGATSAPWKFTWSTLDFPDGDGDAVGWRQGAINSGYEVNTVPAIGAVAWWGAEVGGGLGHVAYVSAVNPDGTVDVEEYNYNVPNEYDVRNEVRADAYLHIDDLIQGVPGPWTVTATAANGQQGYWETDSTGATFAFGAAQTVGSIGEQLNAPIVSMITDPATADGYWLLGADGGVFSFGGATFYGSTGSEQLPAPIVAMAATPSGHGYWLVGSDGSVYPFGDAKSYGSMAGDHLNAPVVGIARTPSGDGYRLVASDGGVFDFGDATFLGSMGGSHLNKPIIGLTDDPATGGYRMVASDGGVFDFSANFYGSLGGTTLAAPIYSMAPSTDGEGYYLVDTNGRVFTFGDAKFMGDAS
jgi:surface antigen/ribosomal protein L24E